jgi:predicted nucleic acid-binding protein
VSVFVDTSALLAVLDEDDAGHKTMKTAWTRAVQDVDGLLTTNYVVLETVALVQRRLGLGAVNDLLDSLLPLVAVMWITEGEHEAGVAALLAAARRRLSLVDCVSFSFMRRRRIRQYLGLDPHFAEQGFVPYAEAVD